MRNSLSTHMHTHTHAHTHMHIYTHRMMINSVVAIKSLFNGTLNQMPLEQIIVLDSFAVNNLIS